MKSYNVNRNGKSQRMWWFWRDKRIQITIRIKPYVKTVLYETASEMEIPVNSFVERAIFNEIIRATKYINEGKIEKTLIELEKIPFIKKATKESEEAITQVYKPADIETIKKIVEEVIASKPGIKTNRYGEPDKCRRGRPKGSKNKVKREVTDGDERKQA